MERPAGTQATAGAAAAGVAARGGEGQKAAGAEDPWATQEPRSADLDYPLFPPRGPCSSRERRRPPPAASRCMHCHCAASAGTCCWQRCKKCGRRRTGRCGQGWHVASASPRGEAGWPAAVTVMRSPETEVQSATAAAALAPPAAPAAPAASTYAAPAQPPALTCSDNPHCCHPKRPLTLSTPSCVGQEFRLHTKLLL